MSDPAGQTSLSMQTRPDMGERVPEGDGGGARPSPRLRRARSRQARVVIRKVAPWSVLKVSFLFYACIMVVILGALIILYGVLGAIGAIQNVEDLIRELFSDETFQIRGDWLFTRGVAVGLLMVVLWSLINVFVALLYNLLSDIVGGIEVTLSERR